MPVHGFRAGIGEVRSMEGCQGWPIFGALPFRNEAALEEKLRRNVNFAL